MIQLERDQDQKDAEDVIVLVDHSIELKDQKDSEDVTTSSEDVDHLDHSEQADLVDTDHLGHSGQEASEDVDHLDQKKEDQKDAEDVITLVENVEKKDHDQKTSEAVIADHRHHSDQEDSHMEDHITSEDITASVDNIMDSDIAIMDSADAMVSEDIMDLEVSVEGSDDVDHAKDFHVFFLFDNNSNIPFYPMYLF